MQLDEIINLLLDPIVLVLLIVVIVIIAIAASRRGPKAPSGPPEVKIMLKMKSTVEKGRDVESPPVKSREEIISDMYESKLEEIGIKPPKEGGHIPLVASSDLSQKLVEYQEQMGAISDDDIEATVEGIHSAEGAREVTDIIDMVADVIGLDEDDKKELQQLAHQEWKRHKDSK
ncbi:MAG: hypothetical protein BAJATHORv1_10054 [Candidatus Thorarchaeota archaeon]|nr:MAG: hypothetical protein BAJATHORv1_10054 [Candidatus Thorarchaeota archaeon]